MYEVNMKNIFSYATTHLLLNLTHQLSIPKSRNKRNFLLLKHRCMGQMHSYWYLNEILYLLDFVETLTFCRCKTIRGHNYILSKFNLCIVKYFVLQCVIYWVGASRKTIKNNLHFKQKGLQTFVQRPNQVI